MKKNLALLTLSLGICACLIIASTVRKTGVSANDHQTNQASASLARLSDQISIHAANRGFPWVNFKDGRDLLTEVAGNSLSAQALQQSDASPLALTSADVDSDGVSDLIASYSSAHGGVIAVYRGNADAIFPNTQAAQQRKAQGTFTDAPFLSPARAFDAPLPPDFIGVGDFDADGHQDILTATRGSRTLSLLKGDGKGGFQASQTIALEGTVTAMATGDINRRDGLADVMVGIIAATGPQAVVLEGAEGAMKAKPEAFALREPATDFVLGALDDDYPVDLAIAAGHDLVTVYGRDKTLPLDAAQGEAGRPAIISQQRLPFALRSIAIGGFTSGQRPDIAALGDDGKVYAISAKQAKAQAAKSSNKKQAWKVRELSKNVWPAATRLLKAKVSSLLSDDVILIDGSNRQLHIIALDASEAGGNPTSSGRRSLSADFDVDDEPLAATAMRLNADALGDLVILRKHHFAPTVVTTLAAMTFTVTTNQDNGLGSFRQAIIDANTNPGTDTINFSIGSGPQTINLLSPLPAITEAVTVDGSTQPEFMGDPIIEVNGTGAGTATAGIQVSATGCAVRSLVISRIQGSFPNGNGIRLDTAGGNTIEGNYIGIAMDGATAAPNGGAGILISNVGNNTIGTITIGGLNLVSGNTGNGIEITGASADGNMLISNFIGTDRFVQVAVPNGGSGGGVHLTSGADNTTIGNGGSGHNLISGNTSHGISIDTSSNGTLVQNNFVGTDSDGANPVGNGGGSGGAGGGVRVSGSTGTTIGGTVSGSENVLSGNGRGVILNGANNNSVQGNFIGTNSSGTLASPNGIGVFILNGSSGNTIGGTAAGSRNFISANTVDGVSIQNSSNTTIDGNFIGTDNLGTTALGNGQHGISIVGSTNNTVGGTLDVPHNLISGNTGGAGVFISGAASTANQVQGNLIGTDVSGQMALGNSFGVQIEGAASNTIGGTNGATRNIISGNSGGILIRLSSTNNTVRGNFIGLDFFGMADLGNVNDGIFIQDSTNNLIGGTAAGAGNVISGNNGNGINIAGGSSNTVQGNLIGTDTAGTTAIGNTLNGIGIGSSITNTIGGATTSARNLISGNGADGIVLATSANGNTIQGNFIGTEITGNSALGNTGSGIKILDSSNVNVTGNVISGNTDDGVHLENTQVGGGINTVRANFIGTDPTGTTAVPNLDNGVVITDMPSNIIGGTSAGQRNIISGNGMASPTSDGVEIGGSLATGNIVEGNFIGTGVNGATALGNSGSGVFINGAVNNNIGGTAAGAGNVISGNTDQGISMSGFGTSGNQVQGNFIGTDSTGTSGVANGANGVLLTGAASSNNIGGTTAGTGNIIAFNTANGVVVSGDTGGDGILRNSIFSNGLLGIDLDGNGVTPNDPGDGDTGGNNLQNFPVITSAGGGGGSTNVQGTLNSTPSRSFRLEFFGNPTCDGTNGEGQTFVGTLDVTTDAGGNANFNMTFSVGIPVGNVVTATATDNTNNSTSEFSACQTVVLVACTIECPPDMSQGTDPNLCNAVVNYPAPTVVGVCGNVACVPASGSVFSVGTTAVTCTTMAGPACSFNVTVADLQPPTVLCPPDRVIPTEPNKCTAVANFPIPEATDNCTPSASLSKACTPPPGTVLSKGVTVVTCKATDLNGTSGSCSFTITVKDMEPPLVVCPQNISTTVQGQTSKVVTYGTVAILDNCTGSNTLNCTPPSGATFPVGTTTVNCIATDAADNPASCSFTITVTDTFVPPGNCPSNMTAEAGAQCAATVSYPLPNISNSPEGTTVACTPPPGASFPVGTTPVSCVITTPSGNRTTCGFNITVTSSTPRVQVVIPGGKTVVEFGTPTPIVARRKPVKNGLTCSPFTITNSGCGAVTLTLAGIQRIGNDVTTGRITNPDDDGLFTVSVVNGDGSETQLSASSTVQFAREQQRSFCVRFNPTVPATAGKSTGLAAGQVLPDTVTSRIAFTISNGQAVNVDLVGHVATAAQFINPNKPRKNPVFGFTRNGNELLTTFSIHDANLDVTRAHYEFLDSSGQVVGSAIDVDLAAPVRTANLVRGQSFTIEQRFTGANSNQNITGVRITVFDGETNVVGSASVARSNSARRATSAASAGRMLPLAPAVKLGNESP